MHPLHKLGNVNTVANYHEYYHTLIKNGTANGVASNAYLLASYVTIHIGKQFLILHLEYAFYNALLHFASIPVRCKIRNCLPI